MLPISVCIIAKNEEQYIGKCLEALKPYHFEIVVVDTGSTDRTKLIARRYTSHVYDYTWCDDFSAARNYSIEKASNDWIFVVDCDEFLQRFHEESVLDYMNSYPSRMGDIIRMDERKNGSGNVFYENSELPRLFHRDYYHYEGLIHEQVTSLTHAPYEQGIQLHVILLHVGYSSVPANGVNKDLRNINLLEQAIQSEPDNPYYHFQLGCSYMSHGDYELAQPHYESAIALHPDSTLLYTKMLYCKYATLLSQQCSIQSAIFFLEDSSLVIGDYCDGNYLLGTLYEHTNNIVSSILSYIKALNCPFYSNQGMKTYLSQYALGKLYEQMGNKALAISFYQSCPDYEDSSERITLLSK